MASIEVRPARFNFVAVRFPLTIALALSLLARSAGAYSGGISSFSGNPKAGGGTICTSCHGGGTAPSVRFEGPSTVTTGSTTTLRFVVHSNASTRQRAAGLDVSVSSGQLATIAGQREQLSAKEITHTSPKTIDGNDEAAWDFNFIAPASPADVTLYGAGNSVNQNGSTSGDNAKSTRFAVSVIAAGPSSTPTDTATPTDTPTPTNTPAPSPTASATTTATPSFTATDTATATSTITFGPSPTPTATRVPGSCVGDCDDSGIVSVDELVVAVRIALGTLTPDFCPAADADHSSQVTVDELVLAVNAALNGCP
ncbi:MAG TPA: choice-of-anchor V domain-containing protein [Candidatus Binatia bacterium]|nr:choice-of-anchor V domain-containing protein [Candidatus Binatia bacterium]